MDDQASKLVVYDVWDINMHEMVCAGETLVMREWPVKEVSEIVAREVKKWARQNGVALSAITWDWVYSWKK